MYGMPLDRGDEGDFEEVAVYEAHDVIQRSLNWHAARLGRISSSKAKRVLGSTRTQAKLVEDLRYELELRERIWDAIHDRDDSTEAAKALEEFRAYVGPELNVRALTWGRQMEGRALEGAQLRYDAEFEFPGVLELFMDTFGLHVPLVTSPDAMWGSIPVEVKCPLNEDVHVRYCLDGPWNEHGPQLTMHALVTGSPSVLFVSFDPRTNEVPMLYTKLVPIPANDVERLREGCKKVWRHVMEGTSPTDAPSEIPKLF